MMVATTRLLGASGLAVRLSPQLEGRGEMHLTADATGVFISGNAGPLHAADLRELAVAQRTASALAIRIRHGDDIPESITRPNGDRGIGARGNAK